MTPTLRDFRLIPVAPGTIMAVNQWSDDVTVQDHCAVMQGKTLWVTPNDHARILKARGETKMTHPDLQTFCSLVKQKLGRPADEAPGFVNTALEFFAMQEAYAELMQQGLVEPPVEGQT